MRTPFLIAALLASSTALADAKTAAKPAVPTPAQLAEMEKVQAPGAMHQWLKSNLAGSWTIQAKIFMGPGETQAATGSAEIKATHGDRFIAEEFTTTMMGKPMTGTVTYGYENVRKRFTSTEIDSRGTTTTTLVGTLDEATKTVTFTGPIWSAMSNREVTGRLVLRAENEKKHTIELYSTGPDGKEQKRMEQVYTRKP